MLVLRSNTALYVPLILFNSAVSAVSALYGIPKLPVLPTTPDLHRVCVCYAPLATKLVRKDARRVDGHQASPEGGGRFARTVTKALWR